MSKLNVLLYNGSGVSASSRDHCLNSLRSFLSHGYDVQFVNPKQLRSEPWTDSCALLVFPGGRDLPYTYDLSGVANQRIREWVEGGGSYLGFCAGGYYASARVEFEVGTPMEVTGDRELGFFPGVCRGTSFPGFAYETEEGAREVRLSLDRGNWRDHWEQSPQDVDVWYNGGGEFVMDDTKAIRENVQVLARYDELPTKPVAGVKCQVGKGTAVLWAVHPEHPTLLDAKGFETKSYEVKEHSRQALLRATLKLLGLDVSELPAPPPRLLPLFLTSPDVSLLSSIVTRIASHKSSTPSVTSSTPALNLADRHDSFSIFSHVSPTTIERVLESSRARVGTSDPGILRVTPKDILVCESIPDLRYTPLFDLERYFKLLKEEKQGSDSHSLFGQVVLYGESVSSTQTMLDKNDKFLSILPTGLTCLASHQIAGRGRGTNHWVSPAGCLQFSLVLRLPLAQAKKIVFIQYLFALAVVEAVRSKVGYEDVGMRVKWPNDVYGEVSGGELRKLGGILVNSSYAGDEFTLVVGCGVNTSNPKPTTSINELILLHNSYKGTDLPLFGPEELLARILTTFESMWPSFLQSGFEPFLDRYLERWIHSDQRVTIAATSQLVRIVGITPDHGLLRTVPLDVDRNGKEVYGGGGGSRAFIDLQPDGNGFDMIKGLLVAK